MDKKSLRAECLAAREALPASYRKEAGRAIVKHLLEVVPPGAVVAGYRATRGEIDVSDATAQLAAKGHTLCLPVVTGPEAPLVFRRWQLGALLVKGKYNIETPEKSAPVMVPDVVIVPLVVFDATGHRLGYGAGYYDRTIAQLRRDKKQVKIIGAAYEMQKIAYIPASSHDEKLDAVATEKQLVMFT